MRRTRHENVATVLVDPRALPWLELDLMTLDLRVWPISTAPSCVDGPRTAFQTRRRLLMQHQGTWDDASDWIAVWVSFGSSWRHDEEPLPWSAHAALWQVLESYAGRVHFHRRLGGVQPLTVPGDPWPGTVAE